MGIQAGARRIDLAAVIVRVHRGAPCPGYVLTDGQ